MVGIISLWIPILLSAVLVFIVSSIIHMLLPYHRSDFGKVPSEDHLMDALRKYDIPPGDYVIPYAGSPKVMRSREFAEKTTKGPVAFLTVMPSAPPRNGWDSDSVVHLLHCSGNFRSLRHWSSPRA
jgi:hypothetical protein